MEELAQTIYEFTERHQTGIKVAAAIIFIICLIGLGACEHGLI
jgi:hypothetical protein